MSEGSTVGKTEADAVGKLNEDLTSSLSAVVVGLEGVVEELLIALLCEGHALLVGVPGLAKTLLIRSIGQLLELDYSRIQFTPDLMPSDITGTEVITQNEDGQRVFSFLSGPVFTNLLLADEINRTPPKTQAALMEAMEENQVTSGGKLYPLEGPFLVFATQNPIEQEGTYPLPAGQLDRFMFNIKLDYPSFSDEESIARLTTSVRKTELHPLVTREEVLRMQSWVRKMHVSEEVMKHALEFARRSRPKDDRAPSFVTEWLAWGVGPRAAQALIMGAKARALLLGRVTPSKEDVNALVLPVFRHRLIPNFQAEADGVTSDELANRLLAEVGGVGPYSEKPQASRWSSLIKKVFAG